MTLQNKSLVQEHTPRSQSYMSKVKVFSKKLHKHVSGKNSRQIILCFT